MTAYATTTFKPQKGRKDIGD